VRTYTSLRDVGGKRERTGMAIYHFSAKIVSRQSGRTALGAAAYRSGERLQQDGIGGVLHDYSRKAGVVHNEILAPDNAPEWARNRVQLWNEIDRIEQRKDAQLAREVEVALPVELGLREQVELLRGFAQAQFVARGMVADIAIHHDNPQNPHAHVLLTLREIGPNGFGDKDRDWNQKSLLREWREAWAAAVNEQLVMAGHEARIDHRSFKEQGIALIPGRKIGIGLERQVAEDLPKYLTERVLEQREIARENGEKIIADPKVALTAVTYNRATFGERDIAKFLSTRTDGSEQFQAAMASVMASPEVIGINAQEYGEGRFTTREMVKLERDLFTRAERMAEKTSHPVAPSHREAALDGSSLSREQKAAFNHILDAGGIKAVVGVAGSGKSTLLAAAREAWESRGYSVRGAALSGIAAENLQRASGIASRTLASYEHSWKQGRDWLVKADVLVIDEAGMVGTRQLARVLEAADKAQAKVVLLGDPEQLQAIEAGAPFRGILATVGGVQLEEVRRQRELWQREATRQLAAGNTSQALVGYELHRLINEHTTRDDARAGLLTAWAKGAEREGTQLMLAHARADVHALNEAARALRKSNGYLVDGRVFEMERGRREFAQGDRIYFLRNEKSLGVKNGTLATIEQIDGRILHVRLENESRSEVKIDTHFYRHLDHGYASTIHKGQGATVDRTYVLAAPSFDRHLTYVALSRHRESAELHYAREDFGSKQELSSALSRARPKELATDYVTRTAARSDGSREGSDRAADPALERFRERIESAFGKTLAEREHLQPGELTIRQLPDRKIAHQSSEKDRGHPDVREHLNKDGKVPAEPRIRGIDREI
jgi:Ti-type conjugative transfer relaxase TraA